MTAHNIERSAKTEMGDDIILPFTLGNLDVRARIVRLGLVVDEIIRRHDCPDPVARLLGEILALASLLGSALKFSGKLTIQVQTDGPVNMLVADFTTLGGLRAWPDFDAARIAKGEKPLGRGQLVLTIDQGSDMKRYQGVVELDGSLVEAALSYFQSSEQIPTGLKIAAGALSDASGRSWRAGAMLIQHLPLGTENSSGDGWRHALALFDTLEDHELLDPGLSPEQLAYRLYHKEDMLVFAPVDIKACCFCSRESLREVISGFSGKDRADMLKGGVIKARCHFCAAEYVFTLSDFTT
jgi:molecular chaperone Hsp33